MGRLDPRLEPEVAERIHFALALNESMSALLRRYFRAEHLAVEMKQDASPVTVADREAEALARKEIETTFPDDGVLGEEWGEKPGGPFRWILDPIDGTESFVRGVPLFGSLIGLEWSGTPVGGVLALPALHEVLHAWRGHGAWVVREGGRPKPARVSNVERWDRALLLTTSARTFEDVGQGDVFARLVRRSAKTRGFGDCYGYALVATGRAEVMIDPRMAIWDCAPLLPILEEAGGRFTDWSGNAKITGGTAVGTNGRFHDEVLAELARTDRT